MPLNDDLSVLRDLYSDVPNILQGAQAEVQFHLQRFGVDPAVDLTLEISNLTNALTAVRRQLWSIRKKLTDAVKTQVG